jgi:hypothetical protein
MPVALTLRMLSGPLPLDVAIAITCRVLDANTQRSAVYTCGVLLWELVTGRTFERDVNGRAVRLSLPALDAIVGRATSLDRTQTFASPRAMSRLLSRAAQPADERTVEAWFAKAS